MPYIRFSDLRFLKQEHREICENLYRDIQNLETQLIHDEELAIYLKDAVGDRAAETAMEFARVNKRLAACLKVTFWYYTGRRVSEVVMPLREEDEVDIFDL